MAKDSKEKMALAEESSKTKKVREKLKRHLQKIDDEVTPQALSRKITEIHKWISRHALQRVTLKSKSISLFDENQNTAEISQKIAIFTLKLKENVPFSLVRDAEKQEIS